MELFLEPNIWLTFSFIILGFSFVVAALGTLLPGIPGAILVVFAALFHNWISPGTFGFWTLVFLGFLAFLSWLADFVATVLGAKLGGATKYGLYGAALGGLAVFVMGIPGLIIGPFIGAVLGDLYGKRKELFLLLKSGVGAAFGFFISLFLRLVLLFVMFVTVVFALI